MRTIIEIPDDQVSALADLCKSEKISRAEAIRRALSDMLSRKKSHSRETAFGAWTKRRNSRAIVEELRREWD